jgi:hypothetical protein
MPYFVKICAKVLFFIYRKLLPLHFISLLFYMVINREYALRRMFAGGDAVSGAAAAIDQYLAALDAGMT